MSDRLSDLIVKYKNYPKIDITKYKDNMNISYMAIFQIMDIPVVTDIIPINVIDKLAELMVDIIASKQLIKNLAWMRCGIVCEYFILYMPAVDRFNIFHNVVYKKRKLERWVENPDYNMNILCRSESYYSDCNTIIIDNMEYDNQHIWLSEIKKYDNIEDAIEFCRNLIPQNKMIKSARKK